jgi:toxin CptA
MAARIDGFKYSGEASTSDPAWRVVLAIGPSRRAEAWIAGLEVATVTAVLAMTAPWLLKAALVVAVVAEAVRAARRHAWQEGPGGLRRLVVDLAGRIELELADGTVVVGRVAEGSFVAPWLTIVRWRPEGARMSRAVVIAPDAVDAQAFRRLRVLLRWR